MVVSSIYSPEVACSFLIFTALMGAEARFVSTLELQLELEMEMGGLNGVDDDEDILGGRNWFTCDVG